MRRPVVGQVKMKRFPKALTRPARDSWQTRLALGHAILVPLVSLLLMLGAAVPSMAQRSVASLDGTWSFRLDPQDTARTERWFDAGVSFTNSIQVPGAWQAQGYGVESDKLWHHYEGKAWYKRAVLLPSPVNGQRVFLCFGGVHRSAEVWIDGTRLGAHIGYLSPFEFDITPFAHGESATISVCVDGRQHWELDCLTGCFDIIDEMFTPWGGLWGHVSLETRAAAWIEQPFVQPTLSPPGCAVSMEILGNLAAADAVQLEVHTPEGKVVSRANASLSLTAATQTNFTVHLSTPIGNPRLWSPESPSLYTARLSLKKGPTLVDTAKVRFGLREIAIRGPDFFLNGKKLFLRGYGDDAIYPKTMAGPSEKSLYLERLRSAREFGFNYVRHHSHILPPEYYEAADEVGMLVSAEFPIAYENYYQKAAGPALDLYRSEWTAVIRRLRNHPSIFDWCMSNESWNSFPLAPELYHAAKTLDPTRPVIDSDGLWPPIFLEPANDRATLDFYPILFDEWSLPPDKPAKHGFNIVPKKPVLSHETGNYATIPRLDLIDLFKDNFKPFWLVPFQAKLDQLGLRTEAERWTLNSERLYGLAHKLNLEDLRHNPHISGYMWWLLQDYWTGANGLFDTYFRRKSISPEFVRRFNDALVLLEEGVPLTCQSRRPLMVRLLASNYGPEPIHKGTLSWRTTLGPRTLAEGRRRVQVGQGEFAPIASIQIALPPVSRPEQIRFEARLGAKDKAWHNDWTTWLYPEPVEPPRLNVPLYAGHDLMKALAPFGARPLSQAGPAANNALFVVSQPSTNLLPAVEAGACLICLSPQGIFPSVPNRFKPAWWLGSEGDCNAGTVTYDHPLTRATAPEGWCDQGWYRLLEGAQAYLLNDFPARPDVILRGLDVHTVCRSKALLFEARVGRGSLIVSGLKLEAGSKAAAPEQQWFLARLFEYGGSRPQPTSALPSTWLRQQIGLVSVPDGPYLAGFARVLTPDAEQSTYASHRGTDAPLYACRQSESGRTLEWETPPLPADWTAPMVTFVFAGGLGWKSQPKTDGFVFMANGRDLLNFDLTQTHQVWPGADGTSLYFFPKRILPEDALGLFYLTIPVNQLKRGEPTRLTVRSRGQASRRWFGLNPETELP